MKQAICQEWGDYNKVTLIRLYRGEVEKMASLRAFFTNMSVPMPLHRKVYLLLRNNAIKLWRRQNCCGHPGEPGC